MSRLVPPPLPAPPPRAIVQARSAEARGHESTTSSIGGCILHLAAHPDAQDWLRSSSILTAAEGILRYESPITGMPRVVAKEAEVGGHRFDAGDYVYLLYSSGNRDENQLLAAERCALDRKPNPHMVFGYGIHACVGAPLARVEIKVALEELLAMTDGFALASEVKRTILHRRGVTTLPRSRVPRHG